MLLQLRNKPYDACLSCVDTAAHHKLYVLLASRKLERMLVSVFGVFEGRVLIAVLAVSSMTDLMRRFICRCGFRSGLPLA
jgi:hypothetical protein